MKRRKIIFVASALVILGEMELILGNHMSKSNALAAKANTEQVLISPQAGEAFKNPTDGELSEEGAKQMGIKIIAEKKAKEEEVECYPIFVYEEGEPLADELSEDTVKQKAREAIIKKYALTEETMKRFTVTCKFYTQCPEVPDTRLWWVNFYPTNTSEFTEIGCYTGYIDAKTGEELRLESAADGKG